MVPGCSRRQKNMPLNAAALPRRWRRPALRLAPSTRSLDTRFLRRWRTTLPDIRNTIFASSSRQNQLRGEQPMPPLVNLPLRATAVIDFWFGPPGDPGREQHREIWFKATDEFDTALRREFLSDYEAAAAGAFRSWEVSAEGALALVLLLDQVPRNIFRGTPRAYAADSAARAVADRALE